MNAQYEKYLESKEWKAIRETLFLIRGRKCERCGNKENIQVHHKTYERIYDEDFDDLEILCGDCHCKEHGIEIDKNQIDITNNSTEKANEILIELLNDDTVKSVSIRITNLDNSEEVIKLKQNGRIMKGVVIK